MQQIYRGTLMRKWNLNKFFNFVEITPMAASVVYYAIITNVSASVDILEYVINKIKKDLILTVESTNIRAWRHI